MASLSPQDIKTLEQTRQRLSQLTNSLVSLQQQILNSDPLPPWSSLHSLSQIISQNLASVSSHLATHSTFLSSLAVYPLPSYPGRDQEGLLTQLLRKKLEPGVEDWVEQGRIAGEKAMGKPKGGDKNDVTSLWEWAGMAANEQARRHEWGGDFTVEEMEGGVENVDTGLKRKFDAEEESDEEEEEKKGEDDEMSDVKDDRDGRSGEGVQEIERNALPMEALLRFLVKGEAPKSGR